MSRWQRFWHSWLDGDPHLVSDHTLTGLQEGASLWISSQVFVRDNHLGIIHTNQGTTNYESETRLLCQLAEDSRLQVTDWWMGDYQNNYQGPVPSGSDSQSLLDYLWRRERSL